MASKKPDVTKTWREYENGVDYKTRINLYQTVRENWQFAEGNQWAGISAPDMPKPVLNAIDSAARTMTMLINDKKLTIKYVSENEREDVSVVLTQASDYARRTWERLHMEQKNMDGLLDAFNTGDYILYHWWDTSIETGQPFKGDVNSMLIDNVNYYPGNPNSPDVQGQPYIILVMRKMVAEVRDEAKKNKVPEDQIKMILPDEETDYVAGEMGQYELDGGEKCNLLLRMWKEDGEVWFSKSTRTVEILKPQKARLKLYPISMMNWKPRKNCCHGVAETTYMKSNQVYLNKSMAFTQLHLLQTAYPKVLYSKPKFPNGWSNKVAAAVGVNSDNIENVAKYMTPPVLPSDVWTGFDKTLRTMMELIGINAAAMGNISNPNNKSAFIAVYDAAVAPLSIYNIRFRSMMRDTAIIFLDFWINHYPEGRTIPVETDDIDIEGNATGKKTVDVPFEVAAYRDMVFDALVEVGESKMWSEVTTAQTLDNLLQNGVITPAQYFKRMPEGYLPLRDELMQEAIELEAKNEQMMEAQQAAQQFGATGQTTPA